jgi:hypothetical protein
MKESESEPLCTDSTALFLTISNNFDDSDVMFLYVYFSKEL